MAIWLFYAPDRHDHQPAGGGWAGRGGGWAGRGAPCRAGRRPSGAGGGRGPRAGRDAARGAAGRGGHGPARYASPVGARDRAGRRGPAAARRRTGAHHRDRAARRGPTARRLRRRPGLGRGGRARRGTGPPVYRRAAGQLRRGGGGAPAAADRVRPRGPVRRDHRGGARPDHRRPTGPVARLRPVARGVHRLGGGGRRPRGDPARGGPAGGPAGDPGGPVAPPALLRARGGRPRGIAGRFLGPPPRPCPGAAGPARRPLPPGGPPGRGAGRERTSYGAPSGWLVTMAGARGEDWGRVILVCCAPPGPGDQVLVERTATALALARLLTRQHESLERQAHTTLIGAIAAGTYPDKDEAAARAPAPGGPGTRRPVLTMGGRVPPSRRRLP